MISPSNSTRPRKVLCEQCSLQVWASVSSSASVGSRPSSAKWAWIVRISARLRDRPPSRLSFSKASSSRPRIGTSTFLK